MARKNQGLIIDVLFALPWWVTALLSPISYYFFKYELPSIVSSSHIAQSFIQVLSSYAHIIAGLIALIALINFFKYIHRISLIPKVASFSSFSSPKERLNALTWREFEMMVAEAYKGQGYTVKETPTGADGGVDIVLHRAGEKVLVQCKQWRTQKVGVKTVRELYGVLTADNADRGIVMCSGSFTREAESFARGKPIELIGGDRLLRMIGAYQPITSDESLPKLNEKLCNRCGSTMVKRTAKRGANQGKQFWGCSSFPRCRHIDNL
ncbi:DUF2034 domain-containing protein [Thalassotalea sp. Y01]|uniref:restriction endonuclease n=1 Tax=Thalassotalea sp. Y01 TaxID=2729613 RepID=UPI00145DEF42|nr:DUF2034 domain-containing protein [Thalassotalea sp. Y01]NMP15174.1 DUF2034 domain-containing protein [Thalassotalea sp. Y01]